MYWDDAGNEKDHRPKKKAFPSSPKIALFFLTVLANDWRA